MSQHAGVLFHPLSGEKVEVWSGFSWPCFFFGGFWYAAKGMWGMGLLALFLSILTYGLAWLVFPFLANGQHRDYLLRHGFLPAGADAGRPGLPTTVDALGQLADLQERGALTPQEFERAKRAILG